MKRFTTNLLFSVFVLLPAMALSQKKDAYYYFQKGEEAMDAQSDKTALAHLNECLRLNPYFMDAYYLRAQVRESLGDSKGALTDFNIYLEARPRDTDALFSRALLRYQYKQWAMAREDFLKLLVTPPSETKSIFFAVDKEGGTPVMSTQSNISSSILNYLGLIDTKMKNYARAVTYLDSAVHLDPKNAEFWINRGWARQSMLDTPRALSDYQQALLLNAEGSLARHNIAVLSAKKGNLKEVERLLTEAIERSPDDAHYYTARAINYTAQGDMTKALADYASALHYDPSDADLWLRRGMLKCKLKDFNGALADYTQSIKLKDDNDKTWVQRGDLMMEMNRVKEAIEDYTIAITHTPEYGLAYFLRALAYEKSGDANAACQDLRKAKSLNIKTEDELFHRVCK
ncbi:MAG: tetratricopeptide repeat protein [Bacteroidetes bacterium]|nr:tetratricopeptide repeat protein [Bacteroidota bacterium]